MNQILKETEQGAASFQAFLRKDGISRKQLAQLLGCSGAALSSAKKAGRRIYVVFHDDGSAEACEISPFPGRKR